MRWGLFVVLACAFACSQKNASPKQEAPPAASASAEVAAKDAAPADAGAAVAAQEGAAAEGSEIPAGCDPAMIAKLPSLWQIYNAKVEGCVGVAPGTWAVWGWAFPNKDDDESTSMRRSLVKKDDDGFALVATAIHGEDSFEDLEEWSVAARDLDGDGTVELVEDASYSSNYDTRLFTVYCVNKSALVPCLERRLGWEDSESPETCAASWKLDGARIVIEGTSSASMSSPKKSQPCVNGKETLTLRGGRFASKREAPAGKK